MEDYCWNCARPGHHRAVCDRPTNPEARELIRRAFREGTGRDAYQRTMNRFFTRATEEPDGGIPPFSIFSREVNRVDQLLYDISLEMEHMTVDGFIQNIGADQVEETLRVVTRLQNQMRAESDNIYAINGLFRRYNDPDYITGQIISGLRENRHRINNKLSVLFRQLSEIVAVSSELDLIEQKIQIYASEVIESHLRGRPQSYAACMANWQQEKNQLVSFEDILNRHRYLFNEERMLAFRERYSDLELMWLNLKTTRKEHDAQEEDTPANVCRICLINPVQWALMCGHLICNPCFEALQNTSQFCPHCRAPIRPNTARRIYF